MATTLSSDILGGTCHEVKHKPQPSQDSGAYIDWNNTIDEEQSLNDHHNRTVEFVTVVSVDDCSSDVLGTNDECDDRNKDVKDFVTILSVGHQQHKDAQTNSPADEQVEDVLVYRLPGERLGFGLKFDGGLNSTEKVSKLLIQSCTPDSPASRTSASWGLLSPGDQILEIDGVAVERMTRIECVRLLKESHVVLNLKVKKGSSTILPKMTNIEQNDNNNCGNDDETGSIAGKLTLDRTLSLPPPVPPRKYPRRISSPRTRPSTVPIVYPPDAFADHFSDIEFFERNSVVLPSSVLSKSTDNQTDHGTQESESDDTGSSMSTVIDRFSITSNSSFSDARSINSVDIEPDPPSPTLNGKTLNLDRVLEPFLQLEREFSSNPIEEQDIFKELVAAAAQKCTAVTSYDAPRRNSNCGISSALTSEDRNAPFSNKTDSSAVNRSGNPVVTGKYGKKRPPPPPPPLAKLPSNDKVEKPQLKLPSELVSKQPISNEHESTEEERSATETVYSSDSGDSGLEMNHLPRLIDFVPKDRTDVIAPSALHPDPVELLLERQRLLDIINNGNGQQNQSSAEDDKLMLIDSSSFSTVESVSLSDTLISLSDIDASDAIEFESMNKHDQQPNENAELERRNSLEAVEEKVTNLEDIPLDKSSDIYCEQWEEVAYLDTADQTGFETTKPEEELEQNLETVDEKPPSIIGSEETVTEDASTVQTAEEEKTMESVLTITPTSINLSLSPLPGPPPPTYSRMPPDGHEFPSSYEEQVPPALATLSHEQQPIAVPLLSGSAAKRKSSHADLLNEAVVLDASGRKYSSSSSVNVEDGQLSPTDRADSRPAAAASVYRRPKLWNKDEKSERSVKDKIAMFSNGSATPTASCAKMKTIAPTKSKSCDLPSSKVFSKSVFSVVDKVEDESSADNLEYASRTRSSIDLTLSSSSCCSSSSSSAYSSCSPESSLSPISAPSFYTASGAAAAAATTVLSGGAGSNTLPRKTVKNGCSNTAEFLSDNRVLLDESGKEKKSMLTRATSFAGSSNLHSRSQSLSDGLHYPVVRRNSEESTPTRGTGRDSLTLLIEQRRRTMSKLRGLVIPEKVSENGAILDLPEIKSSQSIVYAKPAIPVADKTGSAAGSPPETDENKTAHSTRCPSSVWNNNSTSSLSSTMADIPKYSPAFKRKSLALYGAPSCTSSVSSSLNSSREELRTQIGDSKPAALVVAKSVPPTKPPRTSLTNGVPPVENRPNSFTAGHFDKSGHDDTDKQDAINGDNKERLKEILPQTKQSIGKSDKIPDDSDNDSAVSSSRSSLCHELSPASSPTPSSRNQTYLEENHHHHKMMAIRSLESSQQQSTTTVVASNTFPATPGRCSQSLETSSGGSVVDSGDDKLTKRVLKAQSAEAINRKNVLSLARYSSGQEYKLDRATGAVFQNERENVTKCLEQNSNANHQWYKSAKKPFDEVPEQPIKVAYVEIQDSDEDIIGATRRRLLLEEETPNEETSSTCDSDKESSADNLDGKDEDVKSTDEDSDRYRPPAPHFLRGTVLEQSRKSSLLDSCVLPSKVTTGAAATTTTVAPVAAVEKHPSIGNQSLLCKLTAEVSPRASLAVGGRGRFDGEKQRPSVTDLRKAFEKAESLNAAQTASNNHRRKLADFRSSKSLTSSQSVGNNIIGGASLKRESHVRMSSLDSTTSEESFIPRSPSQYGSTSNLLKDQQFGSITSLASSTSLISQQELQQLIEDANHTLEETAGIGGYNVMVIILHRDTATSSVGITLAGGADYECKEITVHKVLAGSPADRDGRIQKGDRILSINGRSMKDVTHREALSILKAPRSEVVLVVSRWKADNNGTSTDDPLVATFKNSRPPRIPELNDTLVPETKPTINRGPVISVTLIKDGGGLGFSLEGGKDSPFGDLPLTIKKIFTGGCADKSGLLSAGDELLSLNGLDVTTMSRTEAWNVMKRLADGEVVLSIRRSVKLPESVSAAATVS